jgi:hypothetical protein
MTATATHGGTRRFRRAILVPLLGAACTVTRYTRSPASEVLSSGSVAEATLYLHDGRSVQLFDVRIEGDSIVGFDRPVREQTSQRTAVATSDVHHVGTRRVSVLGTLLASSFAVLAVATFAGALTCATAASR